MKQLNKPERKELKILKRWKEKSGSLSFTGQKRLEYLEKKEDQK